MAEGGEAEDEIQFLRTVSEISFAFRSITNVMCCKRHRGTHGHERVMIESEMREMAFLVVIVVMRFLC